MKRILLVMLLAGCGGGGGDDDVPGNPDAMTAGLTVPDPGTTVGGEWTDVEPNDTADHAVPVGIASGSIWVGFAPPVTEISSASDHDMFVFRTPADMPMLPNLIMCWSGGDLLDMDLYAVTADSHLGAKLDTASSGMDGCETSPMTATLATDTVYVLDVYLHPGATFTTPVQYSS